MKLYTPEECMQWVGYKPYYGDPVNRYLFQPRNNKEQIILTTNLVHLLNKQFYHNNEKINNIIKKICDKYPQLNKILEGVNIFMCPYPSIGFANAEVWSGNEVVFYSRTTQIPSCMTDYIVVHEFGHVIQYALCLDRKTNETWREYLKLRNAPYGINKDVYLRYDEDKQESIYGDKEDYLCLYKSPDDWDNKPIEWFAEDFRYYINIDGNQQWELTTIDKPGEEIFDFIKNL